GSGRPGVPAHRPKEIRRRELVSHPRPRRDQDEPAEPLADGGLKLALYGRADPGRSEIHAASLFAWGRPLGGRRLDLWSPGGGSGRPPGCRPRYRGCVRAAAKARRWWPAFYRPYPAQVTPPIKVQTEPRTTPARRRLRQAGLRKPSPARRPPGRGCASRPALPWVGGAAGRPRIRRAGRGSGGQAGELAEAGGRVIEERGPVGDHVLELPEQLETDQAEQPGPGDQGTGDDLVGHPGEDGLPDPGGIRGETFGYPWPGSRQAGVFRGWPQNAGSPRAVRVADDP